MGSKYCGVPGCSSNSRLNPELGFFTLPRDEALCVQWTTNMAIPGPARTRAHVKVCALHFEQQSFRTTDCKKLNRGAVPTILHQSDVAGIVSKEGPSENETIPLVAEAEISSAEPSQPLPARFLSNISKKEFVREYRKVYYQKTEAKVLYFQILTELETTIVDDNLDSFKKLSNLIHYINEVESPETLRGYYEKVNNPIRNTNLIILACKHNKVKILEYLFDSNILNNISVAVKRTTLPDDEDETHHNAFYYAIRSGNIKLLDTLINKWPDNYFDVRFEKLDEILSRAYEELKLKNILLSEEIKTYVVSQLINLRFFSNTTEQNKGDVNIITERIKLILENINLLKTDSPNTKPNEKFLFVAKNIAQNIHILKHQLKSTYDRLPWEEIEFCLICFISSFTKQQEINLFYHTTLNKSKILNHLENFAKQLEDEKNKNVQNIRKLTNLPKLKREEVVAKITSNYPQFEELYNDYQQIRDIYSLEKISDYIKLALSADPKGKEGQLIITRALQVIGEFLKNTLESPKLSSTTSELFLMSLPTNARKIIIDLRNSISHAYSLSRRIEIEENSNNFFINIQSDVKKVGDVVNDILYNNKIKTITKLFKKIVHSDSSTEIKEIVEIFNKVELESLKIISENFKMLKHGKLEKLIQHLSSSIPDQTNYEKELFKKINSIINDAGIQSINIETDYFTGFALLKSLSNVFNDMNVDHNVIKKIKFQANQALKNITPKIQPSSLKEIAVLSVKISHSVKSRTQHNKLDEVNRLIYEIFYFVEFETGEIKWIEELRGRLNEKGSFVSVHKHRITNSVTEEKYNNLLALKLSELKVILINNLSSGPTVEKFPCYKSLKHKKLQAVIEMLVLDIMSILGDSNLENNHFFLDDNSPLLTGKCLRNHLAHDNALIDILCDPSIEVMLNAKKLTEENIIGSKKKIGKLVIVDPFKLKMKYKQSLDIITNQEKMFVSLEQGNMNSLKDCLKNGTDLNARSINSWTTLHFAAKGSSLEVIKFIINQNLSVSVKDINNQTPLHIAAAHGRKNIVEFFVKKAGLCIDDEDINGKTPLHIAAQHGHKDTVEVLLKNKANTGIQDKAGLSPLPYAIRNNHFQVAKILLEKDLNVDINETMGGFTPLHEAAERSFLELVNFLIQNNANINAKTDRDWTPLHAAAFHGHVDVVNALIQKGANVNARVLDGCTTLHYAVENGHEEIANILVNHGVLVNAVDKTYNNTPLHKAAEDGHEGIVEMLLKNQANASVPTVEGLTPLHLAVQSGHLNIVSALLRYGVNINAKDKSNATPLHYAAGNGHTKVAELLINRTADINAKGNDNLTPLHFAALNGHEEVIVLLINNQAKVNAQDTTGRTPLHIAAMKCSKNTVDLLIKNKAEINNTNGSITPLHVASINGNEDVIVSLIKNNAEVNARGNYGITPLHSAILGGYRDIVQLLITNNAQLDTKVNGETPLHAAIEAGHKEIIKILVENGVDVNVKCNNCTPLMSAVKHNHKEIVTFLIENGANVNVEDDISLSLAVLAGYKEIVEILLKNKARIDIKGPENVTAIHLAAIRGHKDIVNTLITNGANIDAVTINNTTPLFLAAQEGHEEVVEILIANGANVNIKNVESAPLHTAAGRGHNSVIEVLLNNGANINLKDNKNRTAVELAAAHGHLQVVKTLLQDKEIDINAKGNDDWTILHIASQESNLEIVKYLTDHGSDIHAKNASGSKPIHIAAREGYKETVEYFLSKGSSMNELGAANQTLLHYAAMKGHLEVVKYLIEQGADVNVKDANGSSPLHIAASFGFKDVIEALLKNGAVYNAVDMFYTQPLEKSKDKDVINLLSSTDKLFEAVKRNKSLEVENCIKSGAFVNVKNSDSGAPLHYAAWKGYHDIVDVLLRNKANPNLVGNKGYTALHYAAKFSHFKIVKNLLSNGAVYNAISDGGKTPSDFTVDQSITSLFKFVSESFNNIEKNNCQIVNNINKIKDIDMVKAVMGARNRDNKSLVLAALHSNFSKIEHLKQVSQGDISNQIKLGDMFLIQGNYQKALSIFKRAFETRNEILGPDNPATLDIQTYIAKVLYKQGTYQEALKIFKEIYQKQKEIFGLNYKDTLSTRSSIALVLHRQGKDEEAYNIYEEVYQKQKDILGPSHSDTLNTHFYMALVLDRLGKYEEALTVNRAVFETRKKQLGPNNPATIYALNNTAMVLNNQGKYEQALQIYKEVHEKKKMVLGINHPDTLRTLHSIAGVLLKQKKYYEASKIYQESFNIQKNVLGPNHPDTLYTQYNVANVLFEQGKWIGALKGYKECFDQIKAVFGPAHPNVLGILLKIEVINMRLKFEGSNITEILQHLQKEINIAANNGEIQTVQRLLKDGADVNDKDVDGRTPLHYAVSNAQTAVVNTLLHNGADVTQVTNKGNTPLHTATSKGYKEIVEVLLQHVPQAKLHDFINAKTTASGATSLHVAAKNGYLDVTKSLLKRGAIYNLKNNEDKTPLDVCKDQNVNDLLKLVDELFKDAKNGNIEIISKLEAVIPDEFESLTNARNIQGKTLLQVATANKHKNVASKLSEILRKPRYTNVKGI